MAMARSTWKTPLIRASSHAFAFRRSHQSCHYLQLIAFCAFQAISVHRWYCPSHSQHFVLVVRDGEWATLPLQSTRPLFRNRSLQRIQSKVGHHGKQHSTTSAKAKTRGTAAELQPTSRQLPHPAWSPIRTIPDEPQHKESDQLDKTHPALSASHSAPRCHWHSRLRDLYSRKHRYSEPGYTNTGQSNPSPKIQSA
jgi:hypothetical protein